jgi:hypothetical protein
VKLYCKRTFFKENLNAYPINGKLYGREYIAFKRGKIYSYTEPKQYEKEAGVYMIVESERTDFWLPIKRLDYDKYFTEIQEHRNNKINEILNR